MRPRQRKRLLAAGAIFGVASLIGTMLWARLTPRPPLGVVEGALRDCPPRPSCVCSQCEDPEQHVEPMTIDDPERVRDRLLELLRSMPRVQVEKQDERYVHAVARSLIFGFGDDLEFLIDEDAGVLHVRSAARCGYSDMGVNRRRMERIMDTLRAELGK